MYKLDHIVHFVDSPEVAMTELRSNGLHVVPGGKHEQWGTYNALCYFNAAYIELIGIYDQEKFKVAAAIPYTLHETYTRNGCGKGLTRVAISTTTIEEDAERFRLAGYDIVGPDRFSRTRPDGSIVSWQLLHIGNKNDQIDLPFFIQWDQSEEERVEDMKDREIINEHAAGPLRIAEISYIVSNFEMARSLLQLCHLESTLKVNEETKAEIMTIYTPSGNLSFYRPYDEGAVWEILMEDGPGLYTVVLSGALEEHTLHFENANYMFSRTDEL
ncbi:VOC family protein [Lysinibacillus odysseyi]|uniref:VOC family protein n=1 Tax=Lysinibacillus odysseyi TaxID=202611 RepID=UPI00068E2CB4|nr:VOC family protein [Lysinibacillus odysseyi]